jgi:hypothetical protein
VTEGQPPGEGGESAAEAALRQLRRRYDELRTDYEALLTRLSDLEERSAAEEAAQPVPEIRPTTIVEALFAPLEALQRQYVDALEDLQRLVSGIDDLLPRGMKGQRPASPPPATSGPRLVQIDARGRGAADLLDFRERLAAMEGVVSVSIHAIDAERVVLVVELA